MTCLEVTLVPDVTDYDDGLDSLAMGIWEGAYWGIHWGVGGGVCNRKLLHLNIHHNILFPGSLPTEYLFSQPYPPPFLPEHFFAIMLLILTFTRVMQSRPRATFSHLLHYTRWGLARQSSFRSLASLLWEDHVACLLSCIWPLKVKEVISNSQSGIR